MKAERWTKIKKSMRKPLLLLFAASLMTSMFPSAPLQAQRKTNRKA
jgi:hypothetical protein